MVFIIIGIGLNIGYIWVIRNIFVVIMVVVWIKVEMGVGFFMVFGS